jgi:hypothetical protein
VPPVAGAGRRDAAPGVALGPERPHGLTERFDLAGEHPDGQGAGEGPDGAQAQRYQP